MMGFQSRMRISKEPVLLSKGEERANMWLTLAIFKTLCFSRTSPDENSFGALYL